MPMLLTRPTTLIAFALLFILSAARSVAAEGQEVRPAPLKPLYVSLAALQALDVHSTIRALDRGARESNPVVGALGGSTAALVIVKAASATSAIFLTERLWRRHRVAAVLTMIGVNSSYALIVSHNYGVR